MRNGAGVVDLCGGKRVSVIEDFAHVMFDDQRLEAGNIKGDAAIFSLRKQFPVPDGGLLFVKNGRIGCADLVCEGQGPLLNKFIKYILNRMPLPIKRSYGPEKLVDKSFKGIERISSISETIIRRHVNAQSIRESRRRNFLCYVEKFTKEGLLNDVELVFDRLGDMDIPYMLPVRLKCRNARLVAELRSMGVPAISWPTLPSAVVAGDTYATVRSLRDNIVLLPLHQDITRRHIDHVTGLFSRTIESLGICS
jgi:dTDP-4-amino-4,6-dideoxygalactose transaminase